MPKAPFSTEVCNLDEVYESLLTHQRPIGDFALEAEVCCQGAKFTEVISSAPPAPNP